MITDPIFLDILARSWFAIIGTGLILCPIIFCASMHALFDGEN